MHWNSFVVAVRAHDIFRHSWKFKTLATSAGFLTFAVATQGNTATSSHILEGIAWMLPFFPNTPSRIQVISDVRLRAN